MSAPTSRVVPRYARLAALLLALALSASLGACSGGPAKAPDGKGTLEAELARLAQGGGPGVSVRRSRILRALGRQADALTELGTAQDAAREKLDWAGLTAIARETGDALVEMGRPQEALEAYGKRLKTAVSLDDQTERARALVDTAYALSLMGSMIRADEALGDAKLRAGESLYGDPLTVEHLALTLERLADPGAAGEALGRAKTGFEGAGDFASAARAAVDRAAIAVREGAKADVLDAVEPEAAKSVDPDPLARLRRFQAEAALRDSSYSRCEKLGAEAISLSDRRGLAVVAKLARMAHARCAAENGHLDAAIKSAEEAGFLVEDERQHLTGEQARQEAGFEAFEVYRLLFSLQVKLPPDRRASAAFVTSERARARSHLDAAARSRASAALAVGASSALAQGLGRDKEEAEARVRALTQELIQHRNEPMLAERHRNALWALEDVKDAMEETNPLLARIHVPEPPTVGEVRRVMIDANTALVSYFVAQDEVVAIAIDDKSERLEVLKKSPDVLSRELHDFRRMLVRPGADVAAVKTAAAAVYADVLGPVAALLKSKRNLLIIPDGDLASIPFEALVDDAGKFVVETHDVSYSLSATLGVELAKNEKTSGGRRGFVGMGDPVYDWDSFKAGKPEGKPAGSRGLSLWIDAASVGSAEPKAQGPLLERLPGTATELRAIAKLFGQDGKIYLREQATEDNVKAGVLAGHRIVHIASHGILEPHYQALALTLNPGSKEDGFLLHSEIAALSLDADLVVLSACQTGNTHVRAAEPVAGLALALRAAGARRVVVSLWSVDDEATARLMSDFYRPLVKEGASYGASLSEAKRQMLAKGPQHPYYWAPFVLLGN